MKIKSIIPFIMVILLFLMYGCQSNYALPDPSISVMVTPKPLISVNPTDPLPPHTKFVDSMSFPFPYDTKLEVNSSGNMILSRQQALEDYDAMWEMLDDNYPFFEVIESELGINHNVIREECRAKLLIGENGISVLQFYNQIDSCLANFYVIGHLYIVPPAHYAYTNSFPIENIDDVYRKRMRYVVDSEKVYKTYTHLSGGSLASLFPAIDDSSANVDNEEIKQYLIDNKYIMTELYDDAAYIYIKEFLPPDDTNGYGRILVDMCSEFFKENQDTPNLIIDVSNNPGGGSRFWIEMVRSLITENTPPYSILQCGKSGAYNQYIWDADKPEGAFSTSNNEWHEIFPNVTQESVKGMDWLLVSVDDDPITPKKDSVRYEGNIWVLISRGTYSATEEFAVFCKETGFATLVGSRTGGSGAGSFPLWFALPNSGLLISYEAYYSFNDDGTCNQVVGTSPDINVKNGQTALEACLEAIRKGDIG